MADNSSANKRIAKNSIFMSIRMIIVLLITLYTTRVILQTLGVIDYGVYNVVCGFVSMFTFLNTSMSNGIQRFFNFELGKNGIVGAKKVYNTALIIQFLLAVIIIILTESFGMWYLHNKMVIPYDRMFAAEWIFHFSIMSFLFVIMQAPFTAAVIAHERMDFFAAISVLDAFLKLGIVFALPFLPGDNLIVYGALFASISILNFTLYAIYSRRSFEEIRLQGCIQRSLFKSMLSFSGWNLFGSFSGVMKEQGINLVLNLFFGPVVNAARAVAAQVNSGLQSFVSNITMPVRPQVVQSYAKGDLQRTMGLTISISKLSCGFQYLLALPLSYEIDFVLKIWLGDEVPEHSGLFIVIIFATSFLNNLNSAVSNVIHATGKMKLYQITTSLVALLAVPLAYISLRMGACPEIALSMVTITMFFAQVLAVFILERIVGFSAKTYFLNIVKPLLYVIALTILVPLITTTSISSSWYRLIFTIALSSLAVLLSFYYVGLDKQERVLVKQMIEVAKKKIMKK